MLDIEFTDVVNVMKPVIGSRRNASEVVWGPVLDSDNEPVSIECRFMRRQQKNLTLSSAEDVADATMVFRVDGAKDISRENLVVDDLGKGYRVTGIDLEREKYGDEIYKRVRLKLVDKTFPPAGGDA